MFKTLAQSVPLYIGLRYIRAKRRNGFIAFVSWFALIGMALGVFALIVVLSVMNGFDKELKQRTLLVVPHGVLSAVTPLEDWQGISSDLANSNGLVASAPFIEGKVLMARGRSVKPVVLQGIVPEYEARISAVHEHMLVGSLDHLGDIRYGIVMGSLLARYMGVTVGDHVTITLPEVSVTPAGIFPRSKRFTVLGVFEVGAQVDQHLALIHLPDAQKLFRLGSTVDGLHLKFDDIYAAPLGVSEIAAKLGDDYELKDWSQTQGNLFQAVKMEKTITGVLLSVIIAVAAFNVISSLVMMVSEKRSDIAVLRTLGMTRWGIVNIFVVQGLSLSFVGIIFGAILGVIFAIWLPEISAFLEHATGMQIFDPTVYFVTYLPSEWKWQDTVDVCAFAAAIAFIATLYPAYRASKIEPAEALSYDI